MLWSIDSCQKGHPLPVLPDCFVGSKVQLIEVTRFFLKLSVDQLLVLINRRLSYAITVTVTILKS